MRTSDGHDREYLVIAAPSLVTYRPPNPDAGCRSISVPSHAAPDRAASPTPCAPGHHPNRAYCQSDRDHKLAYVHPAFGYGGRHGGPANRGAWISVPQSGRLMVLYTSTSRLSIAHSGETVWRISLHPARPQQISCPHRRWLKPRPGESTVGVRSQKSATSAAGKTRGKGCQSFQTTSIHASSYRTSRLLRARRTANRLTWRNHEMAPDRYPPVQIEWQRVRFSASTYLITSQAVLEGAGVTNRALGEKAGDMRPRPGSCCSAEIALT
jgi:hypothetical protein